MHISSIALTDVGLRREHNEDAYVCRPEAGLYAVADGMGGHAAGEVASGIAARVVQELVPAAETLSESLAGAVTDANRQILGHARNHAECEGMGTTLTVLFVAEMAATVAHVGDSRLYRFRDGQLAQITRDHTWVQEEIDRGGLTPTEARSHPMSSVITRALGTQAVVEADLLTLDVVRGDVLLLCTDGLNAMLSDREIEAGLTSSDAIDEAARELIARANTAGGRDNITVIVVKIS